MFASISNDVGQQIAIFHTAFNIVTTLVLLPFTNLVVKFVCLIVPEEKKKEENNTEQPISITLYKSVPKGDKMEYIIQKCVELGVKCIVPVEAKRCVARLKDDKKLVRWQKIADEAAKQCGRGEKVTVANPVSFKEAVWKPNDDTLKIIPYENEKGMKATKETLLKIKKGMNVGIFIGAEGGFSQKEIDKCIAAGAEIISLGKRILRTETAAITAVAMCMLYSETVIDND